MRNKTILTIEQTSALTECDIKSVFDALEVHDTVFFPFSQHDEMVKRIARDYLRYGDKMMITRVVKEDGIKGLGICRRY